MCVGFAREFDTAKSCGSNVTCCFHEIKVHQRQHVTSAERQSKGDPRTRQEGGAANRQDQSSPILVASPKRNRCEAALFIPENPGLPGGDVEGK